MRKEQKKTSILDGTVVLVFEQVVVGAWVERNNCFQALWREELLTLGDDFQPVVEFINSWIRYWNFFVVYTSGIADRPLSPEVPYAPVTFQTQSSE